MCVCVLFLAEVYGGRECPRVQEYMNMDEYGSMLFFSAAIYGNMVPPKPHDSPYCHHVFDWYVLDGKRQNPSFERVDGGITGTGTVG